MKIIIYCLGRISEMRKLTKVAANVVNAELYAYEWYYSNNPHNSRMV